MIVTPTSAPGSILKVLRGFAKTCGRFCVERRRERAGLSAIGAWEAPLPMMEVNKPAFVWFPTCGC